MKQEQKNMTFEESLQRLEAIVRQMEQGNVSLQESLKLFEEGSKLARQCGSLLDEAELKVVRLMKGPDGNPVEMEFHDGADV